MPVILPVKYNVSLSLAACQPVAQTHVWLTSPAGAPHHTEGHKFGSSLVPQSRINLQLLEVGMSLRQLKTKAASPGCW